MWILAFGHHEDRTPTHGYAATREADRLREAGGGKAVYSLTRRSQRPLFWAITIGCPKKARVVQKSAIDGGVL